MRVGIFVTETGMRPSNAGDVAAQAAWAEAAGFAHAWVPYLPWSLDAFVALTVAAQATSTIGLGTAVVPTYPFHPMAMARAALSVQAVSGGRLWLGVGPSHQSVIENMYGYRYDRPAAHTREYLGALRRAFALDGHAEGHGEFYDFASMFSVPGSGDTSTGDPGAPVLLVAALAPRMLALCGEVADGTVLWMADETAVAEHVVPRLDAAAAAAGRARPRIVSCMPVSVGDDVEAGRAGAARAFASYGAIPTYQRIIGRGSGTGPADVVLVGPEDALAERLDGWSALGVTDVVFAPFATGDDRAASIERTLAFCAAYARRGA